MDRTILRLLMHADSILLNGPTKRLVSNIAPPGNITILLKTYTTSAGGFFFVKVEGGLGCKERRNWERVVVCRGGGNPQRRLAPLV